MVVATSDHGGDINFKTFAYLSEQSTRLFHDFHEMANPYILIGGSLCKNLGESVSNLVVRTAK